MGALGSGRKRTHANIVDCLVIDTKDLRKVRLLAQEELVEFAMKWRKTLHTNFIECKETPHTIGATFAPGAPGKMPTLALYYTLLATNLTTGEKKDVPHYHAIHLVSTPCHYGGCRWWFACPECSRRVRVLYINPKTGRPEDMRPECRHCLDLNYASQIASYIERHQTYERYLLANYGKQWAEHRYEWELKEHYLEMTPELEALKQRSIHEWNTRLLMHLIRSELAIYRSHLKMLKRLKSEKDRQAMWEYMIKRDKELSTMRLLSWLDDSIESERLLHTVNTKAMPEPLTNAFKRLIDVRADEHQVKEAQVKATEQKIISLETVLKELNEREKKAA